MNYSDFLKELDRRLKKYYSSHKEHVHCKKGCSLCCENGDYPMSQIEFEYLMKGYIELDNETKATVQNNVKNMVKGGICPFLINKQCSVYSNRPIICRVHGIAYICMDNTVKVPYCANEGLNYSSVYSDGEIVINPVLENLDTQNLLKDYDCGEIKNLTDWLTQ